MKYIAIITGASSGIGREFVMALDQSMDALDEIWIVARRKERLEDLAAKLRHHAKVICGDLSNRNTVNRISAMLSADKCRIRFLVNAAGYGILGDFTKGDRKEETGMCDLNVRALTDITFVCLPYMGKNSRIINLASSAAFVPQPSFSVYAATKSYVLSFSRALNAELAGRQIYVTAVCPGPVKTEFFDVAEKLGTRTLSMKKWAMTTPDVVVKTALKDSFDKKEISIPTAMMKMFYYFTKVCPHRLIISFTNRLYR
ncbi:MAG: SDR family NAD(P)-dependent oxidoreductase [Lachnospiraceae bacterium]|nr:SDR family NAD(P)-dependent oxidoreductase [Lachnospiraceae bacterium]